MNVKMRNALVIGTALICIAGLVIAAEDRTRDTVSPDDQTPVAIVPGSPHRSAELFGLPHIELAKRQKEQIETIVKNNQEGVLEVERALVRAKRELEFAKKTGRTKLIELAGFNLGQAIGDQAILDHSVVQAIKDVLTERQLEKLVAFNAASQRWLVQGLLTVPENPARDRDPNAPNSQK